MKTRIALFAIASALTANQAQAIPEVIFDNTVGSPSLSLGAVSGVTYADDATLGGTSRAITSIDISVLFANLNFLDMQADVEAFIYDVGSGGLPGAVLWSAFKDNVSFPDANFPGQLVSFSVPSVVVPNQIRWGVKFTDFVNITPFDLFGPQIGSATSTPAGSANNTGPNGLFRDTGTGFTTYSTGGVDAFAVVITAQNAVPEPTSASLLGLAVVAFRMFRRNKA